jgi:HD-GYP domain-containing protein (c-di-GMP phosphodiesterase class II)
LKWALSSLEQSHAGMLKAFNAVVETHDAPTGEHCERVGRNARTVGHALGLPARQLSQLYWAGLLHDLGKVAVPADIIRKPSSLTREEFELVKLHASFGASLLRSISRFYEPIAAAVESHHERWDGSGYPRGLSGTDIPLFGRILAVVDVFEAMTGVRTYREPVTPEEALLELRAGAGAHFERELVALYEQLYWDGKILVADGRKLEKVVEPRFRVLTLREH